MDGNYITRQEHEEFARRQDAENERQNRRIQLLEDNLWQINALTVSVEKMAVNTKFFCLKESKGGIQPEHITKAVSILNLIS